MTPANASSPRTRRLTLAGYAFTVFLSSALLLVLEIVAARLIAPYVGVSLYTWTSIIGVILAGLSLGNWLGGLWADRGGDGRSVGLVLGLSGVYCILSLPTIGPEMIYALTSEDMYLAGTLLMLLSVLGVVGTLVSDLLLMALDPRIRMGGGSK